MPVAASCTPCQLSGAHVEWEPPGANHIIDERLTDLDDSPPRPQRGDFSSTGGATLGAAKAVFDVSIATCSHTTRVESLYNALETRHQNKLNTYRLETSTQLSYLPMVPIIAQLQLFFKHSSLMESMFPLLKQK